MPAARQHVDNVTQHKSAPDEWSHLEGSLASGNQVRLGRAELGTRVSLLTAANQNRGRICA